MSHTINFATGDDYRAAINTLRNALSTNRTGFEILDIHYGNRHLEATLKRDNLYLVGFKAPNAQTWKVFKGYEKEVGDAWGKNVPVSGGSKNRPTLKNEWRLANTASLNVGCNYDSLGPFGKGLTLNGYIFPKSIDYLIDYQSGVGMFETINAVAMIFAISESLRFKSICDSVQAAINYASEVDLDSNKDKVTNWEGAAITDTDILIRAL